MGTRWRGLLAPINKPTGDGRRMAKGAFTSRQLPLALKWQRVDDQGHDASVVIGLMDRLDIDEAAGEVWGEGELFDDQPNLPRLSEDVAEAMLLTSKKIIGPSVDAGAAEMIFVREGTDTPLTDQDWERLMWEEMETGVPAPIEMLFTHYEIAAATLVVIPAFAEARPFELLGAAADETAPADQAAVTAAARQQLVLTAAAGVLVTPAEVFVPPAEAPAYQMLTVHPPREGESFRRVSGYAAAFGTCHVQIRDMCRTPPPSSTGYALFHRHPLDTDEGLLAVGRLTTGHGLVGTGCTHLAHRGKDDHACDDMSLVEALAHYDRLTTVAWVQAHEYDGVGIWVQGVLAADATDRDLAVLSRQRVSGDWRDHGGRLEMIELLALAREREGFPIPRTTLRNGRQFSLTGAGAVPPRSALAGDGWAGGLAGQIADLVVKRMRGGPDLDLAGAAVYAVPLTAAAGDAKKPEDDMPEDMPMPMPEHTGAMVALRMTDDDAARLAVDGGEPVEELHLTLLYLGEADAIDAASRQAIIDACTALAAEWQASAGGSLELAGNGFAVSLFNAADEDKQTAVVLGVEGEQMTAAHSQVVDAVKGVFGYPAQHEPWVAHVTLAYSDEPGMVDALTDRAGTVTFDRLRIAFGGSVHDIPLQVAAAAPDEGDAETEPVPGEPADDAAALVGEVEAALAAVEADERARVAAALQREIEEVGADV